MNDYNKCNNCIWSRRDGGCNAWDCEFIRQGEAMKAYKDKRKKGQWIVKPAPDKYHCGEVICPFCKTELIAEPDEYHYCPNCGARMDGEADD